MQFSEMILEEPRSINGMKTDRLKPWIEGLHGMQYFKMGLLSIRMIRDNYRGKT